jgi:Lon protease-like protein|tara:strand:+ start:131 stop:760 length:630 start_codon:yes stop_codon:yes gene_type:complete
MNNTFPNKIPIFPLSGVIYFPKTNLPLNIFEKRYLDLVNDAIKRDKLMGMVQVTKKGNDIYKVGCLGKISDYQKNEDGRLIINLTGLTRFDILKEIYNDKSYREFEVKYSRFQPDLETNSVQVKKLDFDLFMNKIKKFFDKNGLLLNWKEFEKLDKYQQINTLAMIAPVSNEEKQKLLETISNEEKTKILQNIVEFYLHEINFNKSTIQ